MKVEQRGKASHLGDSFVDGDQVNGLMAFLRRSLSERHGPRHWPGIGNAWRKRESADKAWSMACVAVFFYGIYI